MREFYIRLCSVKDVQDFVDIATARPFPVTIRDERNKISAKSFMEMFCLNFSLPLRVLVSCSEEEFHQLLSDADRFLVKD